MSNQQVAFWQAAINWVFPPRPEEIRAELERAQFASIDRQVPMLHAVASLCALVIAGVSWHDGFHPASYGWLIILPFFSFYRIKRWRKMAGQVPSPDAIAFLIRGGVKVSILLIGLFGIWGCFAVTTGIYSNPMLIVSTLVLGATCAASSLTALRPAALAGMVIGVIPMSLALILSGDTGMRFVGSCMIMLTVLMIRSMAEQYDRLVSSLFLERQNHLLAHTDPLTGLQNRRAILTAIKAAELEFVQRGTPFGIALLDLDGFKQVNDTLGHQMGDDLLCEFAKRLELACRSGDRAARLGGDEFLMLFSSISGTNDADARANSIMAALARPVQLGTHVIPLAASLGFAAVPDHGLSKAALLAAADKSLYDAKRRTKAEGATALHSLAHQARAA
jgi:diguanylate cyclase (GGDEF)-like protein